MENLSDISVVRGVLSKHGFNFSKALGQNFLINPSVCPRMAESCGADENTGVIEIGAGIGVLTADSPEGPYTDPIGKALINKSTSGFSDVEWLFDPAVLVDDDGTYGCTMDLDEDEMVQYLTGRSAACPYYRFYDEYKSVQKQN